MGSRSVPDDVMLCAEVLGRFGVSAATVCRGVDAERPEDAIAAALERAPSRTEFLKRAISTGPRGIDCPARYARETPWTDLAELFESLGWSFDAEDRSGRSVAATRNPAGPFSVTVTDAEGRRRTATVEYPDTPLGRYNLPGLLAHVERRLLYGFDWRFVALSDGADRWRFALVETDDLDELRASHGDRVAPFGGPLLARHSPVAYGPGADRSVFPDWATAGDDRDAPASATERSRGEAGNDAGSADPNEDAADSGADAGESDTDDLIEFVGQPGDRESIDDDAPTVADDAATVGDERRSGPATGGDDDVERRSTGSRTQSDNSGGGGTVARDPGGFDGVDGEAFSGGGDAEFGGDEDDGAASATEAGEDDADATWGGGFDDLSGWSTPGGSTADDADGTDDSADAVGGSTATDQPTDDDRAHGDDIDGFSLSGSPTTIRSAGDGDDDGGSETAAGPSGPTAAETFTAAAGTVDGATSVDDTDRVAADDAGGETRETADDGGDDDDDFFDGGLAGGPDVSRVENDSFGLPESQTDDERLQAAGAAIDAGGGVSVKGLLDDDSFLPTIPAEGPTEVRLDFEETFDPTAPSPAETQGSDAEDGFVWVNADRLGSES